MRPRLALLLGALVIPVLPAAPAFAAGTICVNMGSSCPAGSAVAATIPAATGMAASGDTILVGPGAPPTYNDGPYTLGPGVNIRGSGAGIGASATVLTLPASASPQTYLTADGGTVQDLRIQMSGTQSTGDVGLSTANGARVDNIVIIGTDGITDAVGLDTAGSSVHDATVNLTLGPGNTAVVSHGGNNALTDSTWNAPAGYSLSGSPNDIVQRVTINATKTGVSVDSGSLNIDDSVLDLAAGSTVGLRAGSQDTTAKSVVADYLTIIGPSTRGVWANASASGVQQTVSVTVHNSIVRGPATSLVAVAAAGSTASLAVDHTDFESKAGAGVSEGLGNLNADPAFIDPASHDYALRAGSPVVDKAVTGVAGLDRDKRTRSFDGDGDGVPVPDMGAYELHDITPPTTVITGGPSGTTSDNTPVFTFRSGPDARFECQLDGGAFQPCTSPVTYTPLPDGPHGFTVRAIDPFFNVEATPPTRSFTVDTTTPQTLFTKKPHKRFFRAKVKFKFTSTEPGAKFQCMLDNLPWRSCSSPFRYSVKVGKHRLLVRAVDAAGNQDATPAHYRFKRIPRPKPHHHHHHRGAGG